MSGEPSGMVFGEVAYAYDRARPGYPKAAAQWLTGPACSVLELGAGTGKLTRELVGLGHDVLATDPDDRMLVVLAERVPQARVATGGAEEINLPDRSVDVVVCAQAMHWFDLPRAVPEIARVLRSDGVLSMVWNERDDSIPWVRRLNALMGRQDVGFEPATLLAAHPEVQIVAEESFRHWQAMTREQLAEMVSSRSEIVVLPPEERAERLAAVMSLYDTYDRGGGLQLPWISRAYRARVEVAATGQEPHDDATLLIDFR